MTALTRGPLPARVYWRRRLLLLLVVLGLVAGTVRLAGLGSDASEEPPQATRAAAGTAAGEAPEVVTAPDTPSESRTTGPRERDRTGAKRDRRPVLAQPEGECADRDVAVTPTVRTPVEGSPVTFTLELRTITTPACTWQVSPSTVTVKITSGDDDIWSSLDCPRAIPTEDVIVRSDVGTEVEVTWSGRRSDEGCTRFTDWAMPGWYYIDAAALAGEPSDLHFQLEKPEPDVVTETVEPKPKKKKRDRDQADQDDQQRDGESRDGDGAGRSAG